MVAVHAGQPLKCDICKSVLQLAHLLFAERALMLHLFGEVFMRLLKCHSDRYVGRSRTAGRAEIRVFLAAQLLLRFLKLPI